MRIKKALKNSIYSLGSHLIILIVSFVSRKLFLQNLSLDFLGYEGLFSNIFSLFSLAEMGTSSVVIYGLYDAVAKEKKDEIAKLMQIYKGMYYIIGAVVLTLGIVASFFIPLMLKGNDYDLSTVTLIYFLQLSAVLCTYFLAYKRMMFIAEQKEHICIKVDTIVDISTKIIRMFVIVAFKNYIIYQLVYIIGLIVSNTIIGHAYNKEYRYIKKKKVTKEDFKSINFFHDIKNAVATQVSGTVHGATDNIIISSFLGVSSVGLISNYLFIIANVGAVIRKICGPLSASIANQVKSEDVETSKKMFFMFTWISFVIASFVSISFMVLLQPFITIAFGAQYLLPSAYVIAISFDAYIGFCGYFASLYRGSFGRFEIDRNYVIAAAIINLTLSIILVQYLGIAGVAVGTAVSQLFFWIGRLKVVYTELIKEKISLYFWRQVKWFLLYLIEIFITFKIAGVNSNFIYQMFVCAIVPNVINLIIFHRSDEFKMALSYLKKVFIILRKKGEPND